jgi:NTP pyrophosphatase (non-canonical NTP hydrolase)
MIDIVTPKEIHQLAIDKGWYDRERPIPEVLMLMVTELAEAMEAHRKQISPGEKGWIGEELADCIIRIFDTAEANGIDIIVEVNKKHEFNKTRPYRHGGKIC